MGLSGLDLPGGGRLWLALAGLGLGVWPCGARPFRFVRPGRPGQPALIRCGSGQSWLMSIFSIGIPMIPLSISG